MDQIKSYKSREGARLNNKKFGTFFHHTNENITKENTNDGFSSRNQN